MSLGLKPKLQPDDYTCNFAALHTAGRYYGIDVKEDVFRSNIKSLTYELGATGDDLADVAKVFGLEAVLLDNATYRQLDYLVEEQKVPVIVEVWDGGRSAISDGHFVTIDEVKKGSICYADPLHRKVQEVDKEDFLRNWFTFDVPYLEKPEQLTLRRMIAVTLPCFNHDVIYSQYLALAGETEVVNSCRPEAIDRMTAAASLGRFFRSKGNSMTNSVVERMLSDSPLSPTHICGAARALGYDAHEYENAAYSDLKTAVKDPETDVIVEWWDGNPLLKNFRHFSLVKDIFTWDEDGYEYISFYDRTRKGVQEARRHDFERNWFGFEGNCLDKKEDLHLRRMVVLRDYDKR